MGRRAFLNVALIVFTLASSLGESLHALPGLSHGEEAACQVRTEHMEAPAGQPHDNCPICQTHVPFQATALRNCVLLSLEAAEFRPLVRDIDFISVRFEILPARAPPLG
jgi:hypothetical protein